MKKFLKIIGILLVIVIIFLVAGGIYINKTFPKVSPAPDLKVEITPQRVERGKYLSEHVSGCTACHATRDWKYFAGPVIEGTRGKGGEVFDENEGFPGSFYSRNITPAGIGKWTDGEVFRAVTAGVNKEGEPLFPIMPYEHFGQMDKEDILSIIAYIRTLQPIEYTAPESKANFPMNFIMRTIPRDPDFHKMPDKSNSVEYGKYVMNAASCFTCHTQSEKGKIKEGMEFAGGFEFKFPDGSTVRSANLTPDNETGTGTWSKELFISKFKAYDKPEARATKPKDYNTPMPWCEYAGMTTEDLGAIFDFLKTVKPVKNKVEKFSLPGLR